MAKHYFILAIIVSVFIVYYCGFLRGHEKCTNDITQKNTQTVHQQILKKEKINAQIYRTGVRDIRDILRTKYTIAD